MVVFFSDLIFDLSLPQRLTHLPNRFAVAVHADTILQDISEVVVTSNSGSTPNNPGAKCSQK